MYLIHNINYLHRIHQADVTSSGKRVHITMTLTGGAKVYFSAEPRRQTVSAPASPPALSLLLINLRVRKPPQSQTPPHLHAHTSTHTLWQRGVVSNQGHEASFRNARRRSNLQAFLNLISVCVAPLWRLRAHTRWESRVTAVLYSSFQLSENAAKSATTHNWVSGRGLSPPMSTVLFWISG